MHIEILVIYSQQNKEIEKQKDTRHEEKFDLLNASHFTICNISKANKYYFFEYNMTDYECIHNGTLKVCFYKGAVRSNFF